MLALNLFKAVKEIKNKLQYIRAKTKMKKIRNR